MSNFHRPVRANITVNKSKAAIIKKDLQLALEPHRFLLERDAKELMMVAGDVIKSNLPLDAVDQLRLAGAGRGAPIVVVEGLPAVENPPPTPIRGYCDDSKVVAADAMLLGIFDIMGINPVAYEYENDGRLVRNVVPNPDAKGIKSSHGFDFKLPWHHDNPCGPLEIEQLSSACSDRSPMPRFLGFDCLRNQQRDGSGVPTELLPVSSTVAHVNEDDLGGVQEPEFDINPPASNKCSPLENVPLLVRTRCGDFLRFNANPGQVFGTTDRARQAIEGLKTAMVAAEVDVIKVNMRPGTVLVFDNYRVSHCRRSFDPGDDWGQARWLRRVFGCRWLLSGVFADRLHWPFLWR